jgi:prepilin-type N-terminal cleavage/methylation domain-containing protein
MTTRNAFTLLEVLLVLMVLGLLAGLAGPTAIRGRDVMAVRAAQRELAAALAVTRAAAIRNGGASFVLDLESGSAWIEAGVGRLAGDYPIGSRYGVRVTCARATPVRIRFDGLGIGRLANTVLRVERRNVSATVTVSAYGRVRT